MKAILFLLNIVLASGLVYSQIIADTITVYAEHEEYIVSCGVGCVVIIEDKELGKDLGSIAETCVRIDDGDIEPVEEAEKEEVIEWEECGTIEYTVSSGKDTLSYSAIKMRDPNPVDIIIDCMEIVEYVDIGCYITYTAVEETIAKEYLIKQNINEINIDSDFDINSIALFDTAGRLIQTSNKSIISKKDLPNGNYFLIINDEYSELIAVR